MKNFFPLIKEQALSVGVGIVAHDVIDRINILQATILAMHKAIDDLTLKPEFVIVDGNYFRHDVYPYRDRHRRGRTIVYHCCRIDRCQSHKRPAHARVITFNIPCMVLRSTKGMEPNSTLRRSDVTVCVISTDVRSICTLENNLEIAALLHADFESIRPVNDQFFDFVSTLISFRSTTSADFNW